MTINEDNILIDAISSKHTVNILNNNRRSVFQTHHSDTPSYIRRAAHIQLIHNHIHKHIHILVSPELLQHKEFMHSCIHTYIYMCVCVIFGFQLSHLSMKEPIQLLYISIYMYGLCSLHVWVSLTF